ncbi:3-deoxy-manno-octulosonate cytidylyltransferase [Limnohabitans sp. Hippo3]|uniref:3-deoxy-manno-octulosonate cytidylyltransferase n=1 Tax=Limnohabitans sp. Hippo3 TaxID=1597956 RepID=UPI000D3C0012|nr:3-deoxy-manno-octulosonate cytidylyltransferase [Limnohabitans sp. Hippo3]PUE43339.1 3-deoxy-manno-octulosonate cytidylyltransferase [Limnohabitans sp. Hippo3]
MTDAPAQRGFTVVIPARMASSRLPDKPLADIGGLPMVVRVAQQALQSEASQVVVAADDERIVAACAAHGVRALLTRQDHLSGSDRLAEACQLLGLSDDAVVVNVQGDEPLMPPALINEVARVLSERPDASMSTAAHTIGSVEEFTNPNVVKVAMDARQMALYFSRAPIPWWREGQSDSGFKALPSPAPLRHIGIYAYRVGFLALFPTLPPAPIETMESLEQLRALWHGHRIAVHVTPEAPGPGVDTPQDLARVRSLIG